VEIGLGLWSMQTTAQSPASAPNVYRDMLEEAALADELGFSFFLLTEHHFWYDGYCPALLVGCGAAAARTRRIKIGTAMVLLPLYDPLRVAEAAAMVDVVSGGRLVLGVSLGYRDVEFDAYAIERRTRGRRLAEGIQILRQAWTNDHVTYQGRMFQIEGAPGSPKPVQEAIPIWVGAGSPAAVERAASLACPVLIPAVVPLENVRRLATIYREAGAEAGVPAEALKVGLMRVVWVDETDARARNYIVPRLRAMWLEQYGGWGLFLDEHGQPIRDDRSGLLSKRVEQAIVESLIGNPDTVRSGLQALSDAGIDILCCRVQTGVVPSPPLRQTMTLLAREVLPGLA
jgi:alkanesulfonate monooxygenase SsuD/methylene tetrahydromethanopterin reductase-like flavin-dependent oxidoreductase (luciferase family)